MKKLIIYILTLMICDIAYGQMNLESINPQGVPNASLAPFCKVDINAPMLIRMERVSSLEECKIKYDLKGEVDSRFEFEVADSVLKIREKSNSKRMTISEAVIYYTDLKEISISRAKVTFEQNVEREMLDITLLSEGVITANIDCMDIKLSASGRSRVNITGQSKYASINASSGSNIDLTLFDCTAAWVDASHSATVELDVSERLEVKSIVGAVVKYHGNPSIVRSEKSLIGGEIFQVKE